MEYNELLKKVENYVNLFYLKHTDPRLFYHNYSRAKEVTETATKIAHHYTLDNRNLFVVTTAVWFHDLGYLIAEPKMHETKSVELAESFLKHIDITDADNTEIKK